MEEDINILERLVEERELVGIYKTDEILLQAIEHLIKAYKELEEYYEEQNEVNAKFIPVSLVEEKIEERKLWLSSNNIGYKDDYVLEVLQELLEKR